jgi:site-specific DNA recombinase
VIDKGTFITQMRVSSRQQEEKYGLEWMRENLRPYGEKYLGTCLHEYDEGVVSTTRMGIEDREVMQDLIADLEVLRPDYLLVPDQDRLARGDDYILLKRELARYGVRLAFYRDGGEPEILDLSDEFDDFRSDIYSAFAKLEKRKTAKRSRRGKQRAAREGKAVQPVVYGLRKVTAGVVEIDEEKAQIARLIFERLGSGQWTIRKLVQWLNRSLVPSPRGQIGGWTISSVAKMVKNTSYIGRAKMMGVEVPVPAIIDESLFERVQAAVARNRSFAKRNNRRFNYLLRGLLRCRGCGCAMCGTPGRNKPYYRCSGRAHDRSKGVSCRCEQGNILAGPIDDLVWAEVSRLVANPELIREWRSRASTVVSAEAAFLKRRLAQFEKRRENLSRQHELGVVSDQTLTERLAQVADEQRDDEARLAELERPDATVITTDPADLDAAADLCEQLRGRLDELSFEEKRMLVEKLVRCVWLDGREITVEVIVPLLPQAATREAPAAASA